jgi:serine/threonine protein kinase
MRYETSPLPSKTINALPIHYTLDDYQITAVLTNDDFSITYKAIHNELDIPVIIKEYMPKSLALRNKSMSHVILKNIDKAQLYKWGLTQYRDEINALCNLHHPNIATVRACIETNNTVYMVTDYIKGKTLDTLVKEKLLTEKENMLLLESLLHGIQAIHEAGFYHSDINPTTIIIETESLTPFIINLGQAKHFFRHYERDLSSYISTGYSPHEQYVAHSKQGVKTDIYAMGATLYYLISGTTPASSVQRLIATIEGKPDPLSSAYLIAQGRYPKPILSAISHAMESLETNRPLSIQDWKKEFGITTKTLEYVKKQDNISPSPKRLEIDFSELNKQQTQPIKQKVERRHYTRIVAITTVMLGVLIAGATTYNQSLNEENIINNTHQLTTTPKQSLTSSSPQKPPFMLINLTTISTVIDNIYFLYPDKKPFLFKKPSKSRNSTISTLSKSERNNVFKTVANNDITRQSLTAHTRQTGRADINKYKKRDFGKIE